MAKEIIMPMLGMTQDSGIINKWHKKEGDKTKADEIVKCVDLCVHQSIEYLREKDGANQFNIKAVGFDCFAMSLVGCELTHSKGLQAITPVYTYAFPGDVRILFIIILYFGEYLDNCSSTSA